MYVLFTVRITTVLAYLVHVEEVILLKSRLDNVKMYGEYIMLEVHRKLIWGDMALVIDQMEWAGLGLGYTSFSCKITRLSFYFIFIF